MATRFAAAQAFAKHLYEQGLGAKRIDQVFRRSGMPESDLPSVDLINKWTRDWTRGSSEVVLWDYLEATPEERRLIARFIKVMIGEQDMTTIEPWEYPYWPEASAARWFIALAQDGVDRDAEHAIAALAAAVDPLFGRKHGFIRMMEGVLEREQ